MAPGVPSEACRGSRGWWLGKEEGERRAVGHGGLWVAADGADDVSAQSGLVMQLAATPGVP